MYRLIVIFTIRYGAARAPDSNAVARTIAIFRRAARDGKLDVDRILSDSPTATSGLLSGES